MKLLQRPSRTYSGSMRTPLDSPDLASAVVGGTAMAVALPKGTYVNPVLDEDFPDPALILAPDGCYYAYATQTLREGHWINVQVARSANLVHWEHLGDALPEKPVWAKDT